MERERKFLVREMPARLSRYPHAMIEQGYLALGRNDPRGIEVRVRRTEGNYVLTVKQGSGQARLEEEISLSPKDGRRLWRLTEGRRLRKVRYEIPYRGLKVELDIYRDNVKGLVVAEVEFESAKAMRDFDPPPWFGRDVSGSMRYSNSRLAVTGWKGGRGRRK